MLDLIPNNVPCILVLNKSDRSKDKAVVRCANAAARTLAVSASIGNSVSLCFLLTIANSAETFLIFWRAIFAGLATCGRKLVSEKSCFAAGGVHLLLVDN